MLSLKQFHKQSIFYLVILTVFTLPLSNSLKSIFLTLASVLIIAESDMRGMLLEVVKKPWFRASAVFLTLILIGLFWGDVDWKTKITYLNKYSKVIYLPLLVVAFLEKRTRCYAIYAFLLAMCVTFCIGILNTLSVTHFNLSGADGGVFQNRIDTGFFMAFAAYLAALEMIKEKGLWRVIFAAITGLFAFYIVFINTGRTGYLVFLALFIVFLCQTISFKKSFVYLPLLSLVLAITAMQSPVFKNNVNLAFDNIKQFQTGDKNTSLGFRLQFTQYAKSLFIKKPLLGYGTGGFTHQFSRDNPLPQWGPKLGDPHNQYWTFAVDYGIFGLGILLYFFFTIYNACRHSKEANPMMVGLIIAFLIGNFCDSLLLLANGGYLFVIFSAIGLSGALMPSSQMHENMGLSEPLVTC